MWPIYLVAFLTGLLAFHAFVEGGPLTIGAGALALGGSIWAAWFAYTWPRQKTKPPETIGLPVIALGALQSLAEHFEHGLPPTQHEMLLVSGLVIGGVYTTRYLLKARSSQALEQK